MSDYAELCSTHDCGDCYSCNNDRLTLEVRDGIATGLSGFRAHGCGLESLARS